VSDDITLDVGLNPAQYIQGAQQLIGSSQAMQASMGGVVVGSTAVQKAFRVITPNRVMIGGFGAAAAAAADFQSTLHQLEATQVVAGISSQKLGKTIQSLSMQFAPLGGDAANAVVTQFTQMGVASQGSEKQIAKLSTTVMNLAGATGESPGGLATGMTQFARATGNANLDPKRFTNLADSLTQVSKTSGATAGDILAFSKNIAPMATAAGIGATGILGISSSFARLGEDGLAAQTAVNKMMTDMSRSVREGGPEMKTYAAITGMTADNFKKMFENDPTKTLNSVIGAVTKAGAGGPRLLEQMGLDGVRSMKAIQALSSSGGLSPAIAQAQKGYGSGITEKAASAAFGSLNDQFTGLGEASKTLAQALGTPLLDPLTKFISILKMPVSGMASAAGSDTGQALMKGIGTIGTAFVALKALKTVGTVAGLTRMGLTSGVAAALQGGMAEGRGDARPLGPNGTLSPAQKAAGVVLTRSARIGESARVFNEQGLLKNSLSTGPQQAAYDFAKGSGNALGERKIPLAGGPGLMGQIGQTWRATQMNVGGASASLMGDWGKVMGNATVPWERRESKMYAPQVMKDAFTAGQSAYGASGATSRVGQMRDAVGAYNTEMRSAAASTSVFRQNVAGAGRYLLGYGQVFAKGTKETAALAVSPLRRGASGPGFALSPTSDIAKMMGPQLALSNTPEQVSRTMGPMMGGILKTIGPMVAISGVIAGISAYRAAGTSAKQATTDYATADMYSTVNAYREASGRAGVPVVPMTAGLDASSKVSPVVTDPKEATRVTAEDIAAGQSTPGSKIKSYNGTAEQIAATIKATQMPGGMTTQDLVGIKADLTRQPGANIGSVQAIMDALGPQSGVTGKVSGDANTAGITSMTTAAAQLDNSKNWFGVKGGWARVGQAAVGGNMGVGGSHAIETRSKAQIAASDDVGKSIQSRFTEQQSLYQGNLAEQNRYTAMNSAMAAMMDKGDETGQAALSKNFQTQLMGADYANKGDFKVTAEDTAKYGGYVQALAALDTKGFGAAGQAYRNTVDTGGVFNGGKGIPAKEIPGVTSSALRGVVNPVPDGTPLAGSSSDLPVWYRAAPKAPQGPSVAGPNEWLAKAYDQTNTSALATAMQASATTPSDVKLGEEAGKQFVSSALSGADNGGIAMSLTDASVAARALANALPETAASARAAAAAMTQIGLARGNAALSQTPQQQRTAQFDTAFKNAQQYDKETASGIKHTDAQSAANTTDRQSMIDIQQQEKSQMQAFLEAQRSYEKAVKRSKAAAALAEEYQVADFNTAKTRQQDAYDLQAGYNLKDFNTSKAYAEHDYELARFNTIRDYNVQTANAAKDVQRSAFLATRDYNVQTANSTKDLQRSAFLATRDYNVSVKNMEADQLRQRALAYRDWAITLARQIADSAKSMFDPYTRIQTKATWDAKNLMVNMATQTASLVKQKSDLDKLRKMGLSAQAIDQLQLGSTENAQQASQLAGDFATNPTQITEMNKAAKDRGTASGSLFTDASNIELTRSKADLDRGLNDSAKTLSINLGRSGKALGVSLADAKKNLDISLARSSKALGVSLADAKKSLDISLARSGKALGVSLSDQKKAFDLSQARQIAEFNKGLGRAKAALDVAVGYMEKDNQKGLDRARLAQQTSLGYMATDVKDSQMSIQGNMKQLHAAVLATMKGQTGTYQHLLNDDAAALARDVGTKVVPKFLREYAKLGLTASDIKAGSAAAQIKAGIDPNTGYAIRGSSAWKNRAEGGSITGYSPHPKADNIPTMLTAGEYVHPVATVQHYGTDFMEKIRTRSLSREKVQGLAEGGPVWPAMWDWAHKRFPGVQKTSDSRPGAITSTGGNSYHGMGSAIDLAPPTMGVFNGILAAFGSKIAELIYSPANGRQIKNGKPMNYSEPVRGDHWDHVHWAMPPGRAMPSAGSLFTPMDRLGLDAPGDGQIDIKKMFSGLDGHHKVVGNIYGKLRANMARTTHRVINSYLANQAAEATGGTLGVTGSTGPGPAAAQAYARGQLGRFGWGQDQMAPLTKLWTKESGWRWNASNGNGGPDSGRAYGIPQSLPGKKMASSGADWRTNPATQINWGLNYIRNRPGYGSPSAAWKHSQNFNWYDQGGKVKPGTTVVRNDTGQPEALLNPQQWKSVTDLTSAVADLVTREESRVMTGAAGQHMTVVHNEHITYDQRNDFGRATISVVSQDPDDMARKLEAKATRQRLTAGRR
jgi:hypothetical protein